MVVELLVCIGGGILTLVVSMMLGGGKSDEFPEGASGTAMCGMLLAFWRVE